MEEKSLNVLNSSVCHFGVCEGTWCWGVAGAGWGDYSKRCSQMDLGNKVSITKTQREDKHRTEPPPRGPSPAAATAAGFFLESLPEMLILHRSFLTPVACM